MYFYATAGILLTCLNLIWFIKMVKSIMKRFKSGKVIKINLIVRQEGKERGVERS